jgi:GNAT superfamily N-acetyltransferase
MAQEALMPEVSIRVIQPGEAALMDAAFALYRDSIERSEQRPEAEFRALAQREDYRFVGALMDGDLIGITVSWIPAQGDIWLFEYAAVAPHMRGNGAGANLFFATRYLAGQHRTALIEVDAYSGAADQARRLGFYKRLGCLKLRGLDYRLPLDAFGAPPPMWLLALPQQETASVSVIEVEDWLRRIYFEVYSKNLDDPRLAQMIDPLPDDVALDPLTHDPTTP